MESFSDLSGAGLPEGEWSPKRLIVQAGDQLDPWGSGTLLESSLGKPDHMMILPGPYGHGLSGTAKERIFFPRGIYYKGPGSVI